MTAPDVRKEFGAAIRAHRLKLGMSQEALAERAELHRTYVTDVERGARNLSLESISRLARALDVSIDSLFSPNTGAGASRAGHLAQGLAPQAIEVLLVEDDSKDVELTLEAFKKAKFANRVEVARDGAAALDRLLHRGAGARARKAPPTKVVLLDLYLPKLNGLEVLRQLRENESTRDLHVIVLTNSRNNSHLREAMRLGADAYIIKPVDFQSFSAATRE
ncbi:MAG: response regulator, partial [Bryobacteraceae bacterium]